MWSIEKVKAVGKASFRRNYWPCVLVSFMLSILGVGYGVSSGGSNFNVNYSGSSGNSEGFNFGPGHDLGLGALVGVLIGVLTLSLVVTVVVVAIKVFVVNPIEIGADRFFFINLRDDAKVREIGFGYDNGYRNIVKILFMRDLYIFLWSLLFIIPGIIKGYEYMMIPYLLAQNPNMDEREVFAESRRMMTGEKMSAFLLDLSFIGWMILSALTAGVVGFFYTFPYMYQTHAALFDALCILKPKQGYYQPGACE